jgi:hypothetical protein
MLKGQCLCGGVQYQYHGELTEVAICHCGQCKRAQGTPFVTNAPIQSDQFEWLAGEALLKSYFSSPNKRRVFCGECGSPLFSQRTDLPDIIRLRLGSVTEGVIPKPDYQIYVADRSEWFELDQSRPCFVAGKE